MERVVFYIESTGESIRCLLNPEGLTLQRLSGIHERTSQGRPIVHHQMSDAPLLNTGGGSTTLELKLLFDVQLSRRPVDDVRILSKPLWDLAENLHPSKEYTQPPIVRLVWGKTWNLPGVITSAAEKFEAFNSSGIPRRSWMSLYFRRISESQAEKADAPNSQSQNNSKQNDQATEPQPNNVELVPGQRLDLLAEKHLGDSKKWRQLAKLNSIEDPNAVTPTQMIKVPSAKGRH